MAKSIKQVLILIFNVIFAVGAIGLITAEIVCEATINRTDKSGATLRRILLIVFGVLSYLFYWLTCLLSETPRFLINHLNAESVYQYMHGLQQQRPIISLNVSCYHYRTNYHHRKNSDGTTTTSTSRSRVTTYSERREFTYLSFEDVSDMFLLQVDEKQSRKNKPCLRLYLKKGWVLTDQDTLYAYRSAQDRIKTDNRWRDMYMDYWENMDVPGFKDYIMTTIGERAPMFFNVGWYILASMLFLNVPYTLYINSLSYELDFTVKKRVSVLPKVEIHSNFAPVSYYPQEPQASQNVDYNPNLPPQNNYQSTQPQQSNYQSTQPDQFHYQQQNHVVPNPNQIPPYLSQQQGYQQM